MGRGRVELKRIQNPSSRQLTFTKRRHGLLKKASELSVLCDAEVSLIISSATGKISEFASHDMNRTLGKYQKCTSTTKDDNDTIGNMKFLRSEMESMQKKLDALEATQKHLVGEDLGSLNLNELQRLERQVKAAASRIHSRKNQVFSEHIGSLRRKSAFPNLESSKTQHIACLTHFIEKVAKTDEVHMGTLINLSGNNER